MSRDCVETVIDGEYCLVCPAIAPVTAVPESTLTERLLGWNGSARSVTSIAGDCYTEFTLPAGTIGAVVGLATTAATHPRDIGHAFYIYQDSGAEFWNVVEDGVPVRTRVVRAPTTDLFRIERRAGAVSFFLSGTLVYRSTTPSWGEAFVAACLYASGDGVN